jgi:hypothetical protein
MKSLKQLCLLAVTATINLSANNIYATEFTVTDEMQRAKGHYTAAELRFQHGRYDDALSSLREAEDILGKSNEVFIALRIRILVSQKEFVQAKFELDRFFGVALDEKLILEMADIQDAVSLEIANFSIEQMNQKASIARQKWQDETGEDGGPLALFWYEAAAGKGDAHASYIAAAFYFEGLGVSMSPAKAIKYWERADTLGHDSAPYKLAELYEDGEHVTKDHRKAHDLYVSSLNRGYTPAATGLGLQYFHGNGAKKNDRKAVEHFKISSEHSEVAAYYLGMMYARGLGLERSPEEAELWLNHAISVANRFELYGEAYDDDPYKLQAALYKVKAEEELKRHNLEKWE